MNRFRLLPFVLASFLLLDACSLIGVTEITAYKVTVEAKDQRGQIVPDAHVTSRADKTRKVKPGIYELLYARTGLYVVTISAPDKLTKQIKVSVPADKDKIFTVILDDTPA